MPSDVDGRGKHRSRSRSRAMPRPMIGNGRSHQRLRRGTKRAHRRKERDMVVIEAGYLARRRSTGLALASIRPLVAVSCTDSDRQYRVSGSDSVECFHWNQSSRTHVARTGEGSEGVAFCKGRPRWLRRFARAPRARCAESRLARRLRVSPSSRVPCARPSSPPLSSPPLRFASSAAAECRSRFHWPSTRSPR